MKCVVQFLPTCECCRKALYQEFNSDAVVLKCVNSECKEFNKPYTAPTVELIPYKGDLSGNITEKK